MASPVGLRPVWHMLKRARIPAPRLSQNSKYFATEHDFSEEEGLRNYLEQAEIRREKEQAQRPPNPEKTSANVYVEYPETDASSPSVRLPRAVQAVYLRPLRREAQYGVPSCDLQLRSYSVRSLEFFSDFALRAAYYLHLPAYGPVPLPRITQRWTVPKSNFIFKKSQENFERVTVRRLIQIKDGHPETVELWLAFLRKHQHHGVGMKANVWEYNKIGVGKEMDVTLEGMADEMKPQWLNFGRKKNPGTAKKVLELMNSEKFRQAAGHAAS